MADREPAVEIGPTAHARWRATTLGAVTEALEQRVVLELVGEVGGRRVLDAGCGDGALVRALAGGGADVTGLDADPAMLAAARAATSEAGLRATFVPGRLDRLPFPDASFDVAVAVTVLCSVPDAPHAVREMVRVLRPGGRLVIGEFARWSLRAMLRRLRGWLGSPTWRRARFRTASDLRILWEPPASRWKASGGPSTIHRSVWWIVAPIYPALGGLTTHGAAFIAVSGSVPIPDRRA